jgi:hypothetical protein
LTKKTGKEKQSPQGSAFLFIVIAKPLMTPKCQRNVSRETLRCHPYCKANTLAIDKEIMISPLMQDKCRKANKKAEEIS